MNRKFGLTMIIVWSIIALILLGILMFFIIFTHSNKYNGWRWNYNMDWANNNWSDKNRSNNDSTSYSKNYEKSFSSDEIENIDVKTTSADINFVKGQGDKIGVKVESNNDGGGKISVSQNGSAILISQDNSHDFWFFNFHSYTQRVTITLPDSYSKNIDLNLTSGDTDFAGSYKLSNLSVYKTSGDFRADTIKADAFTLKSTSGDLTISKLDSKFQVNSTSGDMSFDSLYGSGSISSISGNLTCGIKSLDGPLTISGTSGDVDLSLDHSVSADISANTTSGDIDSGIPMTYSGYNRNHAKAKVGNGPYNTLSVSLLSGDVEINQN